MQTPDLSVRSIEEIIKQDTRRIETGLKLDQGSSRIEVQCLLQGVLAVNRAYLFSHPERMLDEGEHARYTDLFKRRMNGEPIAYLLGEKEFFGHNFKVTRNTLIPRPETELLVELALEKLGRHQRMLDMGTGSGAIAISIAHARPDTEVVALDASSAALEVARENAQRIGTHNVRFICSDWYAALEGERFDLIAANPPYIECNDPHLADISFEPASALVSGGDGLEDIRRIVEGAAFHLKPSGWLMLEHGFNQAARVRMLLQQGGFSEISSICDLSGIERVTMGRA
jgi:release factor glutamine methyltransferase